MKKIDNLGIIIFPSPRSRAYLQAFEMLGFSPSYCLLVECDFIIPKEIGKRRIDYFDLDKSEESSLNLMNVKYEKIKVNNINDNKILNKIINRSEEYFIYTGGGIVSSEVLDLKKFIHVHSGDLPMYRGSTTFYYSLINDNKIVCSIILMNDKIDDGQIVYKKSFSISGDYNLDYLYEPYLRSLTLADFIKKFNGTIIRNNTVKQIGFNETYYIIHPVLKHIAILKNK